MFSFVSWFLWGDRKTKLCAGEKRKQVTKREKKKIIVTLVRRIYFILVILGISLFLLSS